MNTIKFSKIENITTEQHNLEVQNIYEDAIFGKKLLVYHPCNLNIFVTELCQNDCYFCINNKTNNILQNYNCSFNNYYNGLKKLLNELKDKNFEITITGGEPTLNLERFVKTLELCNHYNMKCRTISTTGLNLLKEYNNKPLCQYMIENKFIHNINISRMHWDEDINNEIFKNKNLSNDEIEKLAIFFKLNDAEMRISCNLIPNYIDSFDKMLKFVDFYRNKNIDTIMFRELVGCDNILLKDIVQLNVNNGFEYIKTLDGFTYFVDIYKYKDMLIKHYKTKENFNKDVIFSFAYKNNMFLDNFIGNNVMIKL